jgi:hypothetical protein
MGRIRGAAAQGGLGEKGRLGLGKVSGPKHESRPNSPTRQLPTPSQAPNQTNSTALLVNDFPKFQIPKMHQPNEKKTKRITSNFPSLQTGYHSRPWRSVAPSRWPADLVRPSAQASVLEFPLALLKLSQALARLKPSPRGRNPSPEFLWLARSFSPPFPPR